MFVQSPDGLIVNFAHVMKLRKVDYVLDNGGNRPLIWLKYVTGEEERMEFDTREQRNAFYDQMRSLLHFQTV